MPVPVPDFGDAFELLDGYPRANWDAIWQWVEENVPEAERQEAAARIERRWLDRLASHLGGSYAVSESERFLLLSEHAPAGRETFLSWAEETLGVVEDSLELPTDSAAIGKIPVLVFSEDDDYYDYISNYFSDGHYGLTAGVCIRQGEVHLALRCPVADVRRTFAHELTHACLAHFDLPTWVEEGACEVVSRRAVGEDPVTFDATTRDQHVAYWSWHGLDAFWDGASFTRPDELQSLSYALAETLVRRLNGHDPAAFGRFLLTASAADGGESAARACFGVSLVAFVARLLGEGPWSAPVPKGVDAAGSSPAGPDHETVG